MTEETNTEEAKVETNTEAAEVTETVEETKTEEVAAKEENTTAETSKEDTEVEEKKEEESQETEEEAETEEDKPQEESEEAEFKVEFDKDMDLSDDHKERLSKVFDSQESYEDTISIIREIDEAKKTQETQALNDALAERAEELKKDKEFGKNYSANIESVDKFKETLPKDFVKTLEDFYVADHPVVMKTLLSLAKEREEASVITGGSQVKSNDVAFDAQGKPIYKNTIKETK